jgi:hypothetical protein
VRLWFLRQGYRRNQPFVTRSRTVCCRIDCRSGYLCDRGHMHIGFPSQNSYFANATLSKAVPNWNRTVSVMPSGGLSGTAVMGEAGLTM